MIDIEKQEKRFKDHVAKFTDYGNIKILDFQRPGSSEYRIRFLFQEDFYRLHISGDLGELTASNYRNMNYEDFGPDFGKNPYYFEEKIDCHERPIYTYDEDKARKDIKEKLEGYGLCLPSRYYIGADDDAEAFEDFIDDILEDFNDDKGISQEGYRVLSEVDSDAWEYAAEIGRKRTGIIELYLLAFRLAQEDLVKEETES
ncbi:MAG: hypothetical protein IKX97_01630 [Erysipelotrichaceae bacterium]|nr:hypothetical protein [Clostridiales bacterium]MBR5754511.1 hypothetical protein [Erysipelotrichaceae bacterium]